MVTICALIEQLYMEAVAVNNPCHEHDLRLIYHMAKKMNKKLIEYKTGIKETWTEKDVDGHLDSIRDKVRRLKSEAQDRYRHEPGRCDRQDNDTIT